ncbi:hypothetical protein [Burkholderia cepacia]|uniref:hypothetical protein n=1 Tax=Burkholderia cepacia TaxID=292 RepID=UPI00158D51B7
MFEKQAPELQQRGRVRHVPDGQIDPGKRPHRDAVVQRSLRSQDVILTLSRLMRLYGKPAFVRSDNGADFGDGDQPFRRT